MKGLISIGNIYVVRMILLLVACGNIYYNTFKTFYSILIFLVATNDKY